MCDLVCAGEAALRVQRQGCRIIMRRDPDCILLELFAYLRGVARCKRLPGVDDMLFVLIRGHDSISLYSSVVSGIIAAWPSPVWRIPDSTYGRAQVR
jgi:hypothetical protein